jgi:hypothetical protein
MPAVRRYGGLLASDGVDENGMHQRLKAHRRELVKREPKA